MCLAVCYVFSMSIVCIYYSSDKMAFSGQPDELIGCFAVDDMDVPTTIKDHSATHVSG
eukprot:CAMPEP_0170476366 /NCGR_PEP_ID=MMETSP0123-20130129/17790_1 /TAXON_ID=182087 /ORGANISM="Favella ehrenbergii, Strain Fehren 1" /LENGTH=57 /DNA_ID=CAMNT_0010747351 /DNA_START=125 /DNA_END=298 /DNA_ORIENTATION=-